MLARLIQLANARRNATLLAQALILAVPAGLLACIPASASGPGWTAYVANSGDGTITPVDFPSGVAGTPITVGSSLSTPWAVAFSPAGTTGYVVLDFHYSSSGEVVPVTVQSGAVGTPIPVGAKPWGIAVTPNGSTAYVTNAGSNSVTPINLANDAAGTPIGLPAGSEPEGIAITPDGSTAYVADFGTNKVTAINLSSNSIDTSISVGAGPMGIAVTPNGSFVYVVNDNAGTVTPISTASDTAATPIGVSSDPSASNPWGIAISADGKTAYVSDSSDGGLTTINLSDDQAAEVITTSVQPEGLAISPDGSTVYLSDYGAYEDQVVPVSVASGTSGTPIGVGAQPVAIVVDSVEGIVPTTSATATTTLPDATGTTPTSAPASAPTPRTTPSGGTKPKIRIVSSFAKVSFGRVPVKLACSGGACSGVITVSDKVVVSVVKKHKKHRAIETVDIATSKYSVAKSKTKTISLKLTASGSKLLEMVRTHPVEGVIEVSVHGGVTASHVLHLT